MESSATSAGRLADHDPAAGRSLDRAAAARLAAALDALAASSDLVLLDLGAAEVRHPRALAAALRGPAAAFAQAGRCLLVTGADARSRPSWSGPRSWPSPSPGRARRRLTALRLPGGRAQRDDLGDQLARVQQRPDPPALLQRGDQRRGAAEAAPSSRPRLRCAPASCRTGRQGRRVGGGGLGQARLGQVGRSAGRGTGSGCPAGGSSSRSRVGQEDQQPGPARGPQHPAQLPQHGPLGGGAAGRAQHAQAPGLRRPRRRRTAARSRRPAAPGRRTAGRRPGRRPAPARPAPAAPRSARPRRRTGPPSPAPMSIIRSPGAGASQSSSQSRADGRPLPRQAAGMRYCGPRLSATSAVHSATVSNSASIASLAGPCRRHGAASARIRRANSALTDAAYS